MRCQFRVLNSLHKTLLVSRSFGLRRGQRSFGHQPRRTFKATQFGQARSSRILMRSMAVSQTTNDTNDNHDEFFRYTSGRWVWDEEKQLNQRYKAFNVKALEQVAAQSVGSDSCISMIKVAEGGFNKVFRLIMDDGKSIIARIPNPNAGLSHYTTASEVATMEFARVVLGIPVPQVYAWSANADNAVASEYIIMEEVQGSQLSDTWGDLEPAAKLAVMEEVVSVEAKMLSVSFSHYGSLYFASDAIEGAVPATIMGDLSDDMKAYVLKTFTIGPSTEIDFWTEERATMDLDRGPWTTPLEYLKAIANREISYISKHAVPRQLDDPLLSSKAQNSPSEHINLLKRFLQVAPHLVNVDQEYTRPTLWHEDLHSSNIFVKGDHISSIIDWQFTWAGPLFLQAQPSAMFTYDGEMLLERPENFDTLSPEEQSAIKEQIFSSTLSQLYTIEMEEKNPRLYNALILDHGKTRRMPVQFAGNTWNDDILSLREALLNIERNWSEIGNGQDCPIHFTAEELKKHLEDGEGYNESQDFFDSISHFIKRDGWTSHEDYHEACKFFAELRKSGLQEMKGEEREQFDRQTSWAQNAGR